MNRKQQSIEALVDRYLDYDDKKLSIQADDKRTSAADNQMHIRLDGLECFVGINKHGEPLISSAPGPLAERYGKITYDENPTFISTHRSGAHITYEAAPEFTDRTVPDDTMIDKANRAPLLTDAQVHNALADLQPMEAEQLLSDKLTTLYVGGDPRTPGPQRPYKFTTTYADLLNGAQAHDAYQTLTNVVTRTHGERPQRNSPINPSSYNPPRPANQDTFPEKPLEAIYNISIRSDNA